VRSNADRSGRGARRALAAGCVAGLAAGAVGVPAARAQEPAPRTVRVGPVGIDPNGPSSDPSASETGRFVAFASRASNLGPRDGNFRLADIYVYDALTAQTRLISLGPHDLPANGPSRAPSISRDGNVVAFASDASNLVPGDRNRHGDIYVRRGGGPVERVSVGLGGRRADGSSYQPTISADGRFVAFTSAADNLIAGDDNAQPDVFRVELSTGAIRRVSVTSTGRQARGASSNPSLTGDGLEVSFASTAPNLVRRDRNRVPDVFVRDTISHTTRRVTISTRGREQNAAVAPPFTQISGVSADGRYVVFDSDATNLVRGDRNEHTDVFRHDTVTRRTILLSRSAGGEGSNDSVAPAISADGGRTVFESFADNLAEPWAPVENVFARDVATPDPLTVDVTPAGRARGPEPDAQLLQQPAISRDGRVVVFASGAHDLVAGDHNGANDLFMRVITPPTTTLTRAPAARGRDRRPVIEFHGDDPLARFGRCRLDGRRLPCPAGRPFRLPQLSRRGHVLRVAAGGPGMLFDPVGVVIRFRVD